MKSASKALCQQSAGTQVEAPKLSDWLEKCPFRKDWRMIGMFDASSGLSSLIQPSEKCHDP